MTKRVLLLAISLGLAACAHRSEAVEKAMSEKAAHRAAVTNNSEKDVAVKMSDRDLATAQATAIAEAEKEAEKATAPKPSKDKSALPSNAGTGVDPSKALLWLKHGNTRFVKGYFRKDGRSAKDRERLYHGQKPHAIILSCSDSRVPPELVFDQALGEVFVIRSVGEALDSSVIGSIEYAVEQLGTRLIVVMGHSKCGAIAEAIATKENESVGTPDLDKILSDIRPHIASTKRSPDLFDESLENAKGVAKDLVERSRLIQDRVQSGQVVIKSATYNVKNGAVSFE